jgi:hypothetical protein
MVDSNLWNRAAEQGHFHQSPPVNDWENPAFLESATCGASARKIFKLFFTGNR